MKHNKMLYLALLVILALVCLTGTAPATKPPIFENPEAAFNHYVAGIRENDFDKTLQATLDRADVFEQSISEDLLLYADLVHPDFYLAMSRSSYRKWIAQEICYLSFSLLADTLEDGYIEITTPEDADYLAQQIDPAKLSELEADSFEYYEDIDYGIPNTQTYKAHYKLGDKEYTQVFLMIELDSHYFVYTAFPDEEYDDSLDY